MKTLIVDDHATNRKLLRALLEAESHVVVEAIDGVEALRFLEHETVEAVISDVLMPNMDGLRLCMEVRKSERLRDLPFIIYTSTYSSASDRNLALKAGADRYLVKPAPVAAILKAMTDAAKEAGKTSHAPALQAEADVIKQYNAALVRKLEERNTELTDSLLAREHAERELRAVHGQLRQLLEHSPAVLYALRLEGEKTVPYLVSENMSRLLGFTVAETMSEEWWLGQLHPDDRERAVASIPETVTQGASRTEYRMRHKDGGYRWVDDNRRLVRDAAGTPSELVGVWADITARKQAEASLKQLAAIVESADVAIIGADLNGKIETWNPAAERMFGYTAAEAIGRSVEFLIPPECGNEEVEILARVALGHRVQHHEMIRMTKYGHRLDVSATISPIKDVAGNIVGASKIVRDITKQKRAEHRLKLQHAVTGVLAESAPSIDTNRRILETLGQGLHCDVGELWMVDRATATLRCNDVWHAASPELREFVEKSRDLTFAAGMGLPGFVWASGRVEWSAGVTQDPRCDRREMAARLGLHGWIGFPIVLRNQVLAVAGFFSAQVQTSVDEILETLAAIGAQIGQFIERQQLTEQFRQAQKMEAIGTLAGGIAHDFNNILAAITGYTELTKMELADHPGLGEHLDDVLLGAKRAVMLVRQILAFSRQQDQERKPIQMRHVVKEVLKLLRATIPAEIEFQVDLASNVSTVLADATQIHQIVMNLGTNAAYAMRERPGRLIVKLENCDVVTDFADLHPPMRAGRYVRLSISDTGHGMDEAIVSRIFEPFFTTKSPGDGTGLGLAVVLGIVQTNDGVVTVDSQPGEGTTFQLYFPALGVEEAAPASEATAVRGHGERILFVDDEQALARMGRIILEHLGYVVDTHSDAVEALTVVRANPDAYDLVVTDQMMPRMTGMAFAKELRDVRPDLPIILMCGYAPTLTAKNFDAAGIRRLLLKPISLAALSAAVDGVLAEFGSR